ncbi:helix-turn-helix transcriptional regulator [Streptomyces sp. ME01-24h]|nr:helix-turn-helix transcriptional regulator [Streptomyces sp. ME01-24h]
MERDWVALGRAFASARKALDGMSQVQAAERLGVERGTIQGIERGISRAKVTPTMRSYARLVRWTDDSIDSVLAGGDPSLVEADAREARTPSDDAFDGLPVRIRAELRKGQVLDTGVYDLSPEGSDVQMIVVIQGPSDATAEQIDEYMETVRRAERRLRRIADDRDE